jgi:hypothetical protein
MNVAVKPPEGCDRKLNPVHARAFRRIKELVVLGQSGWQFPDDDALAMLIADTAAFSVGLDQVEKLEVDIGSDVHWRTLRAAADKVRGRILYKMRHGEDYRPFNAAAAGNIIGLTTEKRAELGITTMAPAGETKEQKAARQIEQERARQARYREKKRAEREAASKPPTIKEARPWEAEGVGRSTWFARKAAANAQGAVGLAANGQGAVGLESATAFLRGDESQERRQPESNTNATIAPSHQTGQGGEAGALMGAPPPLPQAPLADGSSAAPLGCDRSEGAIQPDRPREARRGTARCGEAGERIRALPTRRKKTAEGASAPRKGPLASRARTRGAGPAKRDGKTFRPREVGVAAQAALGGYPGADSRMGGAPSG